MHPSWQKDLWQKKKTQKRKQAGRQAGIGADPTQTQAERQRIPDLYRGRKRRINDPGNGGRQDPGRIPSRTKRQTQAGNPAEPRVAGRWQAEQQENLRRCSQNGRWCSRQAGRTVQNDPPRQNSPGNLKISRKRSEIYGIQAGGRAWQKVAENHSADPVH